MKSLDNEKLKEPKNESMWKIFQELRQKVEKVVSTSKPPCLNI